MITGEQRKKIYAKLNMLLGFIGVVSLVSIIALAGFYLSESAIEIFRVIINVSIVLYIIQEIINWIIAQSFKETLKKHWIRSLLAILLILNFVVPDALISVFSTILPQLTLRQITLIYLSILPAAIIFVIVIKVLRRSYLLSKIHLQPGAIFALSFAVIIFLGTVALLLPKATPPGKSISVTDALFTSTSAVCVTGLIVVDTEEDFAPLGKLIILFLIQTGGLGVMTLTTFFAAFMAGGISYRIRIMMKDLLSEENLSEVGGILLKIISYTIIIEIIGAFFLYISLGGSIKEINWTDLYSSVFHSVSAFCNAGFSLYSEGLMADTVAGNHLFTLIIMILIVLGGLGFAVLSNVASLRPRKIALKRIRHQLKLSTKIILLSTAILIFAGALLMFFASTNKEMADMVFFERLYHSLFLSVTARTAGFNTVSMGELAIPVVFIMLLLMWIGASPGSTGGGIKTTTASISFLAFNNIIRGREKAEIFNREIDPESIRKAYAVIFASLSALCVGSIILVWLEPGLDPVGLIFEATSALSTVGLTRDLTPQLGVPAKFVIIALMFIGRIGVFTFFSAFARPAREAEYKLPQSSIMIG